jgi:hypothetical protein
MSLPPVEVLLCQRLGVLPSFIGGTLRLNANYSGPILQVYNGTTTQDVGAVSQIPAFCGASNGFVSIIYDQSGNGRNYTTASAAARPKIYDGGTTTLLRTNTRGPVVMRFDGVDDYLSRADGNGLTGTNTVSIWQLVKVASTTLSGGYCHFGTNLSTAGDITPQFVSNLASLGINVPRITCVGTDGFYFNDAAFTGAVSATYHDDLITYSGVGTLQGNTTWMLNSASLALTAEIAPSGPPNFNNTGSGIGARTASNVPLNGDISCVGMWTPKLTSADQTVLLKFGERWRVQ